MAESSQAPSSGLSIDDLHALYEQLGAHERSFLRELLERGTPRESMVLAQLLHYFPGAHFEVEAE